MRTTFVITEDTKLQSAVRPKLEPHAIKVGDKVSLASSFTTPEGVVPAGAKGFVQYVHDDDGTVEVFMEGLHPALFAWDQTLVLQPFECEDLVFCTRLSVDKMPSVPVCEPLVALDEEKPLPLVALVKSTYHPTARYMAVSALSFFLGWCITPAPLSAAAVVEMVELIFFP